METQISSNVELRIATQPYIILDESVGPSDSIQQSVQNILTEIGEDPSRDGLKHTPERVARMYNELTAGYSIDIEALVNGALFDVDYDDMVLVRDIEFYSLCEHHMLPFFGKVHVAYIPNGKIIGLSKIPRIVEMYTRRLQVQERMTTQIADSLDELLHPKGIAVVVEGAHMCAMMRGVKKSETMMTTRVMRGLFKNDGDLRQDFYAQLSRPHVD